MQKSPWKTTIGSLIIAFCLYTLGGIAADITGFVNDVKDGFSLLSMFAGGDEGGWKPDIGDVIEWMFMTFVILGYLLFFSSLKRFARMQDAEADREQLLRVRTGYILLLLAAVAGFIPVIGWIASLVLFIVGYVKLIGGYGKLKRSTTFADPYNGAGLLRGASIWLLVGAVLGIIPLIGGILETITAIVAFFMTLAGWQRIKQGDPLPAEVWAEKAPVKPSKAKSVTGFVLSIFSFVTATAGPIGIVVSIYALTFSILALNERRGGRNLAIAGVIIASLALLAALAKTVSIFNPSTHPMTVPPYPY